MFLATDSLSYVACERALSISLLVLILKRANKEDRFRDSVTFRSGGPLCCEAVDRDHFSGYIGHSFAGHASQTLGNATL